MQFRLLYEGPVAPRQRINVGDVHKIRMTLHPQLRALWGYKPLSDIIHQLRETRGRGEIAILERSNNVLFAPLSHRKTIWLANLASRYFDNSRLENCWVKEGTSITV
jgi:hypothetical protein